MKKITAAVLCFICATLCGCGARDSSIQQTAQQSETSETDLQNISSVPEVEYLQYGICSVGRTAEKIRKHTCRF